jgi:hypothetical protein
MFFVMSLSVFEMPAAGRHGEPKIDEAASFDRQPCLRFDRQISDIGAQQGDGLPHEVAPIVETGP